MKIKEAMILLAADLVSIAKQIPPELEIWPPSNLSVIVCMMKKLLNITNDVPTEKQKQVLLNLCKEMKNLDEDPKQN